MLALAITFSAMAAEVRLGPEARISAETELIPAPYPQFTAGVVASGGDFLALWRTETIAGTQQSVQVGRIGEKASYGIPGASSAALAADGEELLVAFVRGSTVYVQRANHDGQLLDEPHGVTSKIVAPVVTHLFFDGSAFLLMVLDTNGMTTVLIVDSVGTILRELQPFWRVLWAGVQNGEFAAIDGTDLTAYVLHRFSAFGPRTDITLNLLKRDVSFVAASPSHLFVGQRDVGTLLELDGRVARQTNITPCTAGEVRPQSAWWDGSRFVATCLDGFGQLSARRYREDGTPDGTAPAVLSSTGDRVPLFATTGTEHILFWADHRFSSESDVVARVVHGSDSVAPGVDFELVSYSGRPQRAVQIARAGAHRFAAWRRDDEKSLEAVLDGRTVFVQPIAESRPAVVAGTHSFLTAWLGSNEGSDSLFARRVGFGGELLDSQPRVLATNVEIGIDSMPGVGFRAPLFVAAAAGGDGAARARGITEDGVLVDVGSPGAGSNYIIVKPMWNGNDLQFANAALHGGLSLFFERYYVFGVARPGAASANNIRSGEFYGDTPALGAIAQGPDRLTFAWIETVSSCHMCVAFAQSTLGGLALRDRTVVGKEERMTEIEAAWDGAEFVLAWSNGDRIRAMRLDIDGQPLDSAPFDVSPSGATTDRPSFAVTSTGVDIAYTRSDERAGGVPRAFARSLDRLPPILRGRAVRH